MKKFYFSKRKCYVKMDLSNETDQLTRSGADIDGDTIYLQIGKSYIGPIYVFGTEANIGFIDWIRLRIKQLCGLRLIIHR